MVALIESDKHVLLDLDGATDLSVSENECGKQSERLRTHLLVGGRLLNGLLDLAGSQKYVAAACTPQQALEPTKVGTRNNTGSEPARNCKRHENQSTRSLKAAVREGGGRVIHIDERNAVIVSQGLGRDMALRL